MNEKMMIVTSKRVHMHPDLVASLVTTWRAAAPSVGREKFAERMEELEASTFLEASKFDQNDELALAKRVREDLLNEAKMKRAKLFAEAFWNAYSEAILDDPSQYSGMESGANKPDIL
jgi:hypothetical protein